MGTEDETIASSTTEDETIASSTAEDEVTQSLTKEEQLLLSQLINDEEETQATKSLEECKKDIDTNSEAVSTEKDNESPMDTQLDHEQNRNAICEDIKVNGV